MIFYKKIIKKIFLLVIVYIKWQCDFFYMDNFFIISIRKNDWLYENDTCIIHDKYWVDIITLSNVA